MLTPATFQQHCAQLTNPKITPDARKTLAAEVRDSMELVHSQEYASFLHNFLPAFKVVLSDLTAPQQHDNTIHKTRAIILEVLNRLPHNNVLREKILDVFNMAMDTLKNDNEDNAVTALHIIFDLHKNDRHHLGGQVQPFLEFVRRLYESFGKTVETLLMSAPPGPPPGTPKISPSTQSFKVITECPLLVMFVFQLYPNLIQANIQKLLPLMVRAMQYTVPVQKIPATSKQVFQEFVASQVKTVSFLAYLLKQFPDVMKADEQSIPRSVVKLMQTCPGDSVAIRKELLVATRHILTSRFRRGFFDQIDLLLDERILVGTGRAGTATLRPLAYSFLAELVHCVRLNLSIPQLEKIIFLFSANVHDPKFSYTLQTNSVRLLLNLIEGILKVDPADATRRPAARELLIRILETLVAKYVTLGEQVPRLLDSVVSMRHEPDPVSKGKRLSEVPLGDPLKEIADFKTLLKTLTLGLKTVIWSAINIRVPQANTAKSTPSANLAASAQQRKSATPARQSIRTGLLEKECEIVSRLLFAGRNCFRLYSRHEKANSTKEEPLRSQIPDGDRDRKKELLSDRSGPTSVPVPDLLSEYTQAADPARVVAASPQEEREVFDQFAQIFTVLDPPSFQDVFGLRIADLFEYIVENGAAITIPQHFLANSSVSKYFADIMFNFLIENMGYLDVPYQDTSLKHSNEGKRANCLLKLFKILFASVSLFPTNEPVLRLHLQSIVRTCLKHASKAKDPHAYLQMLRALFKSITSGKHEVQFEVLYRDFMPLVEPIFSHLLSLYAGPSRLLHRELIIELCLMVPARPSTIFPYLEQQIKPIVWALEGGRENPMYGLRTLEFWVDMLQPGYLRLLLLKVEPDLSRALHRHLRPPGNAFGPGALRILGKLGARSRSQKTPILPFKLNEKAEFAQRLSVEWQDGLELNLETDELICLAGDALLDRRDRESISYTKEYKGQAWKFLFACLCPFLRFQDETDLVQLQSSGQRTERKWYFSGGNVTGNSRDSSGMTDPRKERKSIETATVQLVSTVLRALLASAKIPELNDAAVPITSSDDEKGNPETAIKVICKYFALLSAQKSFHTNGTDDDLGLSGINRKGEQTRCYEGLLSPNVFVDALVDATSLECRLHAKSGLDCLHVYVAEMIRFCITKESSSQPEDKQAALVVTAAAEEAPESYSAQLQDSQTRDTMEQTKAGEQKNGIGNHKMNGNPQVPDAMEVDVSNKRDNTETNKAENDETHKRSHSPDGNVVAKALAPLVNRLCHCCHRRTWNARWAGVHGLRALTSLLPSDLLSSRIYRASLMRSFAALLFLARDTTDFGDDGTVSLASEVLQNIIFAMFHPSEAQTDLEKHNSFVHSELAHKVYKMLASELTSGSPNARKIAKMCFGAIAKAAKQDEADIVVVVRDQILRPVQERPIRQHSLRTQIGFLDAVNFCLQLGKPIVCKDLFSPPLKDYVLVESMHIMDTSNLDPSQDADDGFRAKYHENKYLDGNTTRQLLLLRRKVLDFLCNVSVHCSGALQEGQHERIFRLMISCFFRCLQSRDEEIVQSAKRGLKHAISKHPKPKEVLQVNLRPLLGNLGDYKKLTLQYLQGLNRVLELFSHWFNVNLGEKLLEHLQRWTEPEKIPPLKKMMAGSESKVAAAILDLFHLLPAAASKFMEQIVNMVLKLESVIALAAPGAAHLGLKNAMGACTSPYRTPLLKYANQHAAVASKYFLEHLDDDRVRQLFFVMVRSTESVALRKDLMQMPKRLLSISHFSLDDNTGKSLYLITLIDLLSRHDPTWLKADAELMPKLLSYWKLVLNASELRQNNAQSLSRVRAVRMLAEIFIRYYRQFPEEINILFDLLAVFSARTICDFTFVRDFLHVSVTQESLHPNRKAILTRFLSMFQDNSQSQERKVHALQYIVTPMVVSHLESGKECVENSHFKNGPSSGAGASSQRDYKSSSSSVPNLSSRPAAADGDGMTKTGSKLASHQNQKHPPDEILDTILIQRIMKELLDQPDMILRDYEEPLSAELLRLATVLIQYMPKELGRYRKEVIKFGWNHLKREDSIAKHWAFVYVSRFFEAYQAPLKIILQVYVALLRACQGDGKELVQQALDVLTPALPVRLVHNPSDHKYPIWIRYTKKILLEEGHSVPNLVHIWQLIARHPNLFYVARAQFVPIMVNSLSRIGLNTAPPTENRRLALDLVHLILNWEKTRRANAHSPSTGERETSSLSLGSKKRAREDESKHYESVLAEIPTEAGRDSGAEPPAKTRKSGESQPVPVSSSQARLPQPQPLRDADDFKPSPTMVDMLINFLTQVLFRPMDRREAPVLTRRCISLLGDALSLWPDATVRLHFVEKLLAPLPSEKNQVSTGAGSPSKGVANQFPADFGSSDAKNAGKGEVPKNDKMEQARLKRAAVRHSALMTSLLLARVLTKHLGKRFIEGNLNAIRALLGPAVSEGSLQAASQFASLLSEIFRACSISVNSTLSKDGSSHPSQSEPTNEEAAPSKGGGTPRASERKQEKSGPPSQANATDSQKEENAWLAKLAAEIGMAIETCLKSNDATKNHCGMIVLRVFSTGTPREFTRYQESLAKALHRMTKENLSAAQPPSSAGGSTSMQVTGTAGPLRSMVAGDKGSSLNVHPNARGSSGSNSNQNQEKGNDAVRGTKSPSGQKNGQQSSQETRALLLCLSLLGENIATLEPGQRKTLFHVLWALIDRCVQVEVLLEIVRIVETWVFWKPHPRRGMSATLKEPLSAKEKVHILLKMIIFERISGHGSQELMNAYLTVILRIFGGADPRDKRPELMPKLERAFMLGLKTIESSLRKKFFQIYDASVDLSLALRLNYIIAKQDWEHLSDTFWIKHAAELILSAVNKERGVRMVGSPGTFTVQSVKKDQSTGINDDELSRFKEYIDHISLNVIIAPLLSLSRFDPEVAHKLWILLVPKTWEKLSSTEQMSLERSIALLLTKEYHQIQVSWRRNNVQSLLESVARCHPLPLLRPDVVRHLGSKWNAWHSALNYLERKESELNTKLKTEEGAVDDRQRNQIRADLEDIFDSQAKLFSALHERDYFAGLWKHRAKSRKTTEALCLEQIGLHMHAQETYSEALSEQVVRPGSSYAMHRIDEPGKTEIVLWEQRWIECARNLCQWEVLTELSRTSVHSDLLHECLWRLPDWSALKELLIKNPVEDGPQLKIYQAYVQLQENKLEVADNFITQGYLKAQEKFCSLPETFDLDATIPILVQFQQLVELQESTRVLSELNALSRHGSGGVNVDQKVDNIRLILNTWRERLPSIHEPLSCWNDILTWRNHVHAVVVNVLDALKEAANAKVAAAQGQNSTGGSGRNAGANAQTAQVQAAAAIAQALSQQVLVMGVNETAWNVHRFAKACRKQGYPDVALYVLQKMYPFGTMELTEYFVKTKETARSFMDGPKGLHRHVENGLHELNRCNMDHFNSRQKAQLFAIKGKLCMALGREDDAVEAFSAALHTSPDVGSAWLAWGQYCDTMQSLAAKSPSSFSNFIEQGAADKPTLVSDNKQSNSCAAEFAFRETAVTCYIHAARFGSSKTRSHFPRILRLLSVDLKRRLSRDAVAQTGNDINVQSGQSQTTTLVKRSGGSDQIVALNASSDSSAVGCGFQSPPRTKLLQAYKQGVSQIISSTIQDVPAWMWVPWIPQLVSMLKEREAIVIRPLLIRLAQQYPQAVFYSLKSFTEDRKQIDKPAKALYREAMKLGRPITAALKMSASPQLSSAMRQTQAARESFQRANQRFHALRKELENVEKAIVASEGTPEHAGNLAKKGHLKNDLASTHRILEKCMHALKAATQRQRQIQEILTGIQTSQSGRQEMGVNSGKPPTAKAGDVQEQKNRADSGGKNRSPSDGVNKSSSQASCVSVDVAAKSSSPFEHADAVMTELVRNHQELHYDMDMITTEISMGLRPTPEDNISALMSNLLQQCYNLPIDGNKEVINALRKTLEDVGQKYFGLRPRGQGGTDEKTSSYASASLRQAFQAELAPETAKDFPTDIEGIILRLRRWEGILQRQRNSLALHQRVEDVSKYLTRLNDSEVEVFGQYLENEFTEPSIDKHIKIVRFCSEIGVCRGPTGTCREFYVMGSDGKAYHFLVETGTKTSVQIAEERMSQLYRLLNCWVFGKNCDTQRRRIQLTVPILMCIGNKVRLQSHEPGTSSLACVANRYLRAKGSSPEDVTGAFRKLMLEGHQKRRTSERKDMTGTKMEAFDEICRTHMPDWCLSRLIRARMPNETANFIFRKRLAETLGYASLVSYVVGVEARGPERLMLSWKYGAGFDGQVRLLTKNIRLAGSSDGVPFRLTRNIEKAVGRFGVTGPFFGCMASSLHALRENDKLIETWIDMIEREELGELVKVRVEGALKKAGSSVKIGPKEMESAKEKMLEDLVSKAKTGLMHRLNGSQVEEGGNQRKENVMEMSERLIARAKNVDKQLEMDLSWQAWL